MHEVGSEDVRWRVNYEVAQATLLTGHQVVLVASEAASEPKLPLIHKLTSADAPPRRAELFGSARIASTLDAAGALRTGKIR